MGVNKSVGDISSLFASFIILWMIITPTIFGKNICIFCVIVTLDDISALGLNITNCGNTTQDLSNTQGDSNLHKNLTCHQ